MTRGCLIVDCACERPDWPFVPVDVACGSSLTIGVKGLRRRFGATLSGCRIRVTNADGVSVSLDCVLSRGVWCATFPASHFQNYGTVKHGVVIFSLGRDERNVERLWIERVGDLRVSQIDASSVPGGTVETPKDVFHKSEIIDGVQHYKREVLTYSARQNAWGAEYVGDYVFIGGDYVPFTTGE